MVQQRHPHLERMGHAGAVDLGQDVARQVGLEVEVLQQRQRVVGRRLLRVAAHHLDRAVALQPGAEAVAEQLVAHPVRHDRHAVEVALDQVARQRLEGGLGAEHARRPVGLRVQRAQGAEQGLAQAGRQLGAHAVLGHRVAVAAVAGEILVAAVARQRHRHLLSRQLAHAVGRDRRAVGIRLVVQVGEGVDQAVVVLADHLGMVAGAVALGHHVGVLRLVEIRVVEADRAGGDRVAALLRHHRHHRARIDAAGQEGAQRHLGFHLRTHRFLQARGEFLGDFGLGTRRVRAERQVPVALRAHLAVAHLQGDAVAGAELEGVVVDRVRFRHVAVSKIFLDRARIQFARQLGEGHDRLQFRAEHEQAVRQQRIEHRLDADMVARQEQGLLAAVPDAEGEHAAQAAHAVRAPGLVSGQHHLGVRLGAERDAERDQLVAQLAVVVDLAVEDDHRVAVAADQRLLAGGDVDHRQAAVAHAERRFGVQLALVRPAVELAFVHAAERPAVDFPVAVGIKNSDYSAHRGKAF